MQIINNFLWLWITLTIVFWFGICYYIGNKLLQWFENTQSTIKANKKYVSELQNICKVFKLSKMELAALFRQSVENIEKWNAGDIPVFYYTQIELVSNFIAALEEQCESTLIPKIIRTKDIGLGNRTILQVLTDDGLAVGLHNVANNFNRIFSYIPE
jgi:hypothetical protein